MPTFADLRPVPTAVGCAGRVMGWTDVGVLITPCVPGGHALLEHRDVLVVRHESTSNSGAAPNDSTVRSGLPQDKKGFPSPAPRSI
jgi:hypothetical protein